MGSTDGGPRTTPAIHEGSVYVLTSYLKLLRLNATNGIVVWSNDLRLTYGCEVIGWQNAASPLVDSGVIHLNAYFCTSNLMALRTSDGSPAWRLEEGDRTHSTPVLATLTHGLVRVTNVNATAAAQFFIISEPK